MKLLRGITCALVGTAWTASAPAHALGGRPHLHAGDAVVELMTAPVLLPIVIAAAAMLLAALRRPASERSANPRA